MPATRTARRTAPAAGQLALLLPEAPATVDGVPGQLDLVAALLTAELAADLTVRAEAAATEVARTGRADLAADLRRAVAAGQLDRLPALIAATVEPIVYERDRAAAVATLRDRQCHGRTKASRRCMEYVRLEWKGSLLTDDGRHWCRQHAYQGLAATR